MKKPMTPEQEEAANRAFLIEERKALQDPEDALNVPVWMVWADVAVLLAWAVIHVLDSRQINHLQVKNIELLSEYYGSLKRGNDLEAAWRAKERHILEVLNNIDRGRSEALMDLADAKADLAQVGYLADWMNGKCVK